MKSDKELYELYLAGEIAAYDELIVRYGDSLTFYLNGYLHNLQDAEDLMVEAFARIMVKKPKIKGDGVKTYLYKTARNLASRFHRRESRMNGFSIDEVSEEGIWSSFPEESRFEEERKEILHYCMERIDPQLKEALWLIYFEELSYDQAAEVMNVNRKKIDHLLQKGKKSLKEELLKEGVVNAYR